MSKNTYFEKMYKVNPENWTLAAAVVLERIDNDKGTDWEYVKYQGFAELDWAIKLHTNAKNRCQHCNHRISHFVALTNEQNGDSIVVGWDCFNNTFTHENQTSLDLARAKQAAENILRREAIAKVAESYREKHSELVAFMKANSSVGFYSSLLGAIDNYGSLTERQEEAAYESKAKWEAKRQEETEAPAKPAPEGKGIRVTGIVLKTKWYENQYGGQLKMTVKSTDGWRVFCTVPSTWMDADNAYKDANWQDDPNLGKWGLLEGILNDYHIEEGMKVRFVVNLEQANNDETMAWGKRPRKAEVLS